MRCVTVLQVHCALQRPDSAVVSFQTDGVVHFGAQLREAEQWHGGLVRSWQRCCRGSGHRAPGTRVWLQDRWVLCPSAGEQVNIGKIGVVGAQRKVSLPGSISAS